MISSALAINKDDGQRNELAEFYEQNKDHLFAFAYSKLHNYEQAEDAIQEAFLRVAAYPKKFFEIPCHKRASYVVIIIRNIIYDTLSKNSKINIVEPDEEIVDNSPLVDDKVIGKISSEELFDYIKTIPESQKQVVYLKIIFNLNNSEIAKVLNISETAVRKRLSRAYKLISDYLNREEH